jgi:hypothetical protein
MSSIDGGSFESGFPAGAVSSLVASGIEALGGLGGYYTDDDYTQWSNFASRNPAAAARKNLAQLHKDVHSYHGCGRRFS